eukprot:COSAG02_NODE_56768_length_284_cov_0.205405_1_plen_46_part_01
MELSVAYEPLTTYWLDASSKSVSNEASTLRAEQIALVEQTIHPQSP